MALNNEVLVDNSIITYAIGHLSIENRGLVNSAIVVYVMKR